MKVYFLIAISLLFFLLRLPSLFEPYWYGDEGIYETIGLAIRNGRLLYQDIWDNKPPLLYLVYGLFSGDQFSARVLSLIFGVLTVIVFFILFSSLIKNHVKENQKSVFIITSIFAILFASPLLEGNIANSENFMMLPILTSGLLLFNTIKNKSSLNFQFSIFNFQFLMAGFLISIAFLFKIVAIFDLAAFCLFIFFATHKDLKSIFLFVKDISPLLIGFLSPILLISLFFFVKGAFMDFFRASFIQNVGYVGYGNSFIIPQGFLILKLIILGGISVILFIKRSHISQSLLFTLLWFSFSVFNAFFSGRPYTHYMLVLLPSFMIFLGFIFKPQLLKPFYKISLISFVIIFILVLKNFNFYSKTIGYYQNFILFLANERDVDSYRAFFDRNTPRDYEIAKFIKANLKQNESIFVWGDNAQLYPLTSNLPPGRFTVAYHMRASEGYIRETHKAFLQKKPRFVIVTTKNPLIFPINLYKPRYTIHSAQIYERSF